MKNKEEVCKLLVEKHPEFIKADNNDDGHTVLHHWLEIGEIWPFKYLLENNYINHDRKRELVGLIDHATDKFDKTPLIFAIDKGNVEATKMFVYYYTQDRAARANEPSSSSQSAPGPLPWLRENNEKKTPLDLAILAHKEEVALSFLSPEAEINSVLHNQNNPGFLFFSERNPLFLAIEQKCYKVAEKILDIQTTNRRRGWCAELILECQKNVLHQASKYKEEVATWLVNNLPKSFISAKFVRRKSPLEKAIKSNEVWPIEAMLMKDPSSLNSSPLAWVPACKNGHVPAVLAFIKHCPNFRDVCFDEKATPLHYIKLEGYSAYKNFLKIPIMDELKYIQDSQHETPLHRAISSGKKDLVEAILTMNWIDWKRSDKTSMESLATKCTLDKDWDAMCKRASINPKLKMTYVQHEANLIDMRSTLSVVAALLATITFTAGFTLPDGFKIQTEEETPAKKRLFLAFLVVDALAMCSSLLVLFNLVWSIISDHNKSLVLIDRSMKFLLMSLYSTLVAFMMGVYAAIFHKSLAIAISIMVLCSLFAIIAIPAIMDLIQNSLQSLAKLGNACKCWGRPRMNVIP